MKTIEEKLLKALAITMILLVFGTVFGITICYTMKSAQIQLPYRVTGYTPEDNKSAERKPICSISFQPGDTLTLNEAGVLILWDSTMDRDLQVAVVKRIYSLRGY